MSEAALPAGMEILHSGRFYNAADPAILEFQRQCMQPMYAFNATNVLEGEKRAQLMRSMLGSCGEGTYIEPPFYANWGGHHLHLGRNVYINFGLTAVDDTYIEIGDDVCIGPNVTIATAVHPENPEFRRQGYQKNLPVKIRRGVWIGAGAVICPGVTIGEDSVIGAGSVVTRSIPEGVLAIGSPCRPLRPLRREDRSQFVS